MLFIIIDTLINYNILFFINFSILFFVGINSLLDIAFGFLSAFLFISYYFTISITNLEGLQDYVVSFKLFKIFNFIHLIKFLTKQYKSSFKKHGLKIEPISFIFHYYYNYGNRRLKPELLSKKSNFAILN